MKAFFYNLTLCMVLAVAVLFSGCGRNQNSFMVDYSVDMTPRQISVTSADNFIDIVDQVRSAVVGISAISDEYYSVGSGVAVAEDGYILTNYHVVEGAKELTLYFANKTQSTATTIWGDSALDLAIIKADTDMPYLELGNINDVKVGEDVIAIGTPLTLQFKHTVTKGIVSALNRTLEIENTNGTAYLQNLIQHDASINPGNSGGALVNKQGKLIGINTVKATEAEGIGFAIPINVGQAIISKIAENNGYKPPYLGVFGFDAEIAQYYGQTMEESGVYVVNIDSASPTYMAGLRKGDVIKKLGDKEINSMLDLRIALYSYDIGEQMSIGYTKNGEEKEISFTTIAKN